MQPHALLLQMSKACFALPANGHQSSGNRDLDPLRIKRFTGHSIKLRAHSSKRVRGAVAVWIGLLAKRDNLLKLLLPQREQPALKLRIKHVCFLVSLS